MSDSDVLEVPSDDCTDPDVLISYVCAQSIVIQDMIEDKKPEALEEFNKFYDIALKALDLQLEKVSSMDMESSNYYDEFSQKSEEFKTLRDQVFNLAKEREQLQTEIDKYTKENEEIEAKYNEKADEMSSEDFSPKLSAKTDDLERIKKQIADVDKEIASIPDTKNLLDEIPQMMNQLNELENEAAGRLKKNKRKAIDLEQKIRKSNAITISLSTDSLNKVNDDDDDDEPEEKEGPSTIIHRTKGTVQDQIRELKTALEEALKKNGELKTNLSSAATDHEAMKTENLSLKEIMRSLQTK